MLQSTNGPIIGTAQDSGFRHRTRMWILFSIVCSMGGFTGCAERKQTAIVPPGRPDESVSDRSTSDESTASVEKNDGVNPIDLLEVNWSQLQLMIAEHKGKIVVVDVWSTSCEPCLKEFPQLIALQDKYPNDVVAISFDVDFSGIKHKPTTFYRDRVLNFLNSQKPSRVTHRMSNTATDELFSEIQIESIPAVFVYGRDGNVAKRFEGTNDQGDEISYKTQIIPFVDQLVKSFGLVK